MTEELHIPKKFAEIQQVNKRTLSAPELDENPWLRVYGVTSSSVHFQIRVPTEKLVRYAIVDIYPEDWANIKAYVESEGMCSEPVTTEEAAPEVATVKSLGERQSDWELRMFEEFNKASGTFGFERVTYFLRKALSLPVDE